MKSKAWEGPTGVIVSEPFELRECYKRSLREVLGPSSEQKKTFILNIEEAIGIALGVQKLRSETLPSAIKKNIKKALKKTSESLKAIRDLDPSSKKLIAEHSNFSFIDLEKSTARAHEALRLTSEATLIVGTGSGRLYDGHKRYLAYLVAEAMQETLNVQPTLTRTPSSKLHKNSLPPDLYHLCIRTALEAANFIKPSDNETPAEGLHTLMKEGLETLKTQKANGGIIELRKGST